ncbi:MAG: EI24 domain-containing protein [Dysgonomonas sp.]|nr:EI24 domain-containing protein [Dysgonomonas sp.]
MEQPQKIKLFASRDFGGNFDTSFAFIKQNYGAIIKPLLILIPIMLISAFFTPNTMDMSDIESYANPFDIYRDMLTPGFFIAYFFLAVVMLLMSTYIISYLGAYVKSPNGIVDSKEVWPKAIRAILPVFLASIIYGVIVGIGTVLCIIPGIIAYVYLGFYAYVYIIEERSIIDSFQRSYELVKNNWWTTFGFGIVITLIISIVSAIFAIPTYMVMLGHALDIDFFTSDLFFYIASFIANMGSLLLYPILYVAMGVMYFSHRNKLEGVDMETEIDNIGNNEPKNTPNGW